MAIFQYINFAGEKTSYGELPIDVLAGEEVFTIEVIFSTTDTQDKNTYYTFGTIAGRDISGGWKDDWSLCVNAGCLCFWARAAGGGSTTNYRVYSDAFVSDGEIHRAAVVSNQDGSVDLYCDGVNVAHKDSVNARITNQETILLGYNSDGNSALDMNLYEIRFWAKARMAEEIFYQHAKSGQYLLSELTGSEAYLQAWYIPTNDSTLTDKTSHGFNATLTGVSYNPVDRLNISYNADVSRAVKNAPLTWRYYNAGTASKLSISGTSLKDLPDEQSKTGIAFFQTALQKCFDISASPELWIKFDVYFDGGNRWRAYNANNGNNQANTGVSGVARLERNAAGKSDIAFFEGGANVKQLADICEVGKLQTFLMYLKSGEVGGMIEIWTTRVPYTWNDVDFIFENDNVDATLKATVAEEIFSDNTGDRLSAEDIEIIFGNDIAIDENKIFTYIGNVNNGLDFANFYLQSDGAGTFFSNVIISNALIDLYEGMTKAAFSLDVERILRNSLQVSYDVAREVHNITTVEFTADVKIQSELAVTMTADISRQIVRACELNLDVAFLEAFHDIDFTVDVRRSIIDAFTLYPIDFDGNWQAEPVLRYPKKRLLADTQDYAPTPIFTPPNIIPAAQNTGDIQSIEVKISEQQITDVVKFTTITPFTILADVLGRYLDFVCKMRVESVQKQGSLYSVICCSNIDELLYTPLNYELPSITYGYWYNERTIIPRQICPLASQHVSKIAEALNLQTVMQFQDFYSTVEFGANAESGASYNDIIRDIFGWTSRVPTELINVFIRDNVLYVIQRGFESRVIDITHTPHTQPAITHELVRMFYKRSKWSDTEVREKRTRRKPEPLPDTIEYPDDSGGSSSGDSQWVNASKVTVESSDGTTVTTYYYDADGLLLKSEAQYTCYSDATKNCTTTTTNSYDSDGTITKVSVEAVHANAPDEDTRSDTRYGYINFLGKKFLATEVVEKYSRQNGGWVKDDTIVTTKNPTGRGQGAASDSKGNVSASGNRGDDRVSPFYSDDNLLDDMDEDNSGDEYDTTTQSRDIDGLTLFDTSFPIQNITRARFENLPFPPIGLTEEDIQNIDTAKGQGRLIELTEKIKWLNRKTKETITLLVYDVPHLIDFTDRIRFCGNEYYLVENTARAQSRLRNEQNLTLVRWF